MNNNPWKEAGERIKDDGNDLSHHTDKDVRQEKRPHHKIAIAMSVVGLLLFAIGLAPFISDMGIFKASVTSDPLAKFLTGAQSVDNVDPINSKNTQSTTTNPPGILPPAESITPTPVAQPINVLPSPLPSASVSPTPTPTTEVIPNSEEVNILGSGGIPALNSNNTVVVPSENIQVEKNSHTGSVDNVGTGNATKSTGTTHPAGGTVKTSVPKNVKTGPEQIWFLMAFCLFGAVIIRSRKEIFSFHTQY